MKLISILTISVLFFSCGTTSTQNEQPKSLDENWEMTNHTFISNTYNKSGLLDTSYKTMYVYHMEMLIDTIKSIVVRKYDNNKLINEKEFTLWKDGTKTLSSELIKQYDTNEHLILFINKIGDDDLSKTVNEYNEKGQVVKSTNLFQKVDDNPNDYNLDSVVAHRNDKKQFHYDTTINTFKYDLNGNEIRRVVLNVKGFIQKTSITQYSGNEKIFSFDITMQGDTIAKFIYNREGNFIKQIADIKEMGAVDTTWFDKEKIIKVIGHNDKMKMKYKFVTIYNDKGDEIENVSYK